MKLLVNTFYVNPALTMAKKTYQKRTSLLMVLFNLNHWCWSWAPQWNGKFFEHKDNLLRTLNTSTSPCIRFTYTNDTFCNVISLQRIERQIIGEELGWGISAIPIVWCQIWTLPLITSPVWRGASPSTSLCHRCSTYRMQVLMPIPQTTMSIKYAQSLDIWSIISA